MRRLYGYINIFSFLLKYYDIRVGFCFSIGKEWESKLDRSDTTDNVLIILFNINLITAIFSGNIVMRSLGELIVFIMQQFDGRRAS